MKKADRTSVLVSPAFPEAPLVEETVAFIGSGDQQKAVLLSPDGTVNPIQIGDIMREADGTTVIAPILNVAKGKKGLKGKGKKGGKAFGKPKPIVSEQIVQTSDGNFWFVHPSGVRVQVKPKQPLYRNEINNLIVMPTGVAEPVPEDLPVSPGLSPPPSAFDGKSGESPETMAGYPQFGKTTEVDLPVLEGNLIQSENGAIAIK